MQNSHEKFFSIIIVFFILISIGCSDQNSTVGDIYSAEEMFFKVQKLQRNIMINPDVASPDLYENTEKAYREIINKFGAKSKHTKAIKGIVQRSWLAISELQLLQKNYDAAIDLYKEIIEKSSYDIELCAVAQYSIALGFEKLERFDEAIDAYKCVIKDYPPVLGDTLLPNINILQTPIHIARLYRQKQKNTLADEQYAAARTYYEKVITEWPNSPVALSAQNQIAISYGDQGDWAKTTELLNDLIYNYQDKHDLSNYMFALGNIYQVQLKQPDKALDIYEQILQKYPENKNLSKVHLAIGGVYMVQKDYEMAIDEFKNVINNYPDDKNACIQAQLTIARAYELDNNWNKALNEYQWVLENYPKNIQSLNIPLYIADYYQKKNENNLAHSAYENAIKRYQQVGEKYPKTRLAVAALDFKATCYMRIEKWHKAAIALQSLVRIPLPPQKQANIYLLLGKIYEEKLKDMSKAIEAYSTLLQKYPEIPIAKDINSKAEELQEKLTQYLHTNTPPTASKIYNVNALSGSSLEINWEQNRDEDFSYYKLIRSKSAEIDTSDTVVAKIYDQNQIQYLDKDLKDGGNYYYRLYTYDRGGLSSVLEPVATKLQAETVVAAVQLQASSDTWSAVSLSWTKSDQPDFDYYKIFRSLSSEVSLSSQAVKTIFDKSKTQFEDTDLKEKTTYYYKVYVYNSKGANKPSNAVEATTATNLPPMSIVLDSPSNVNNTTIKLSWSKNNDDDFSMYRLYRSENSPVQITGTPIWMKSNKLIQSYKDTDLKTGKTYYYKAVVYDKGGLCTESNEVSIKL